MKLEVTINDSSQEYYIGRPRIVDYMKLQSQDIIGMVHLVRSLGSGEWLNNSTNETINEMDNCTKKLIRKAEIELLSAKKYVKNNFPVRYKISFIKVIIKNPLKTILAKCLLR